MDGNIKKSLLELGTEPLADALLELANRHDAVNELVERIIATPKENVKRFKAKLASLKRSRRFVDWAASAAFASKLETMLQDLQAGIVDSKIGCELIAAFYKTDKKILEICDDSNGHVGDVYRFDAKELFVNCAQRCTEKEWLANLVFELNQGDDYGVRTSLIDCAVEYLPEPVIRKLINKFQETADKEKDEYEKQSCLYRIESLARQIKDATLFEKTRIASWGKLTTAACLDIAHVYLESGDAHTALSWIEKTFADKTFHAYERDQLLFTIFGQLGKKPQQKEVAWRIFRSHRSKQSLEKLLSVIGEELRESVIKGEAQSILAKESLSLSDAEFLVKMDQMDAAERYLLERVKQLDGECYGSLLPLAKAMETYTRNLAATVIYRALLDSILQRGQSKAYPHGVRYLKKLDLLAKSISDWHDQVNHNIYLQQIRQTHGRKTSFWHKY